MPDKYGTGQDPYCYKNSSVLINKLNLTDNSRLQAAEAEITMAAARGIPFDKPPYDFDYLKNIHFQLFSKIYDWAGQIRTIDISKEETRFCIASRIEPEADKVFKRLAAENFYVGYSKDVLIKKLAELYGDLNMVHPFREGNGRAQRILFEHIAYHCDYELDWGVVSKNEWTQANIRSVFCDFGQLEMIFRRALSDIE